ncbi:hypothetical protein ACFFX1_55000 [Dactylosporangium sucinum]|uniref:Uncharacterized protein n=1 Tax=Dactylosporangium sucinum TaxID=1424081 RepID=A0A917X0A5_9ACTN|nr:hypothetical protein [Dactylosporangium sucinum]GGM53244.1 hypothetical protein GCM10007977_063600 [Dactylosporangium sucinum]
MPWYANQKIRQGTALAYDVGHPVPATNVELHGYDRDGLVTWVEPGEHFNAEPEPAPVNGLFPNAPQPSPAVPDGVDGEPTTPAGSEPAAGVVPTDGTENATARRARTQTKPTEPAAGDGTNATSTEG